MKARVRPVRSPQLECDDWNRRYPVGTAVEFYPVIYDGRPEGNEFRVRETCGEAYVLSGHTAVIQLIGERGCVLLDACRPIVGNPEKRSPQ